MNILAPIVNDNRLKGCFRETNSSTDLMSTAYAPITASPSVLVDIRSNIVGKV
jgi:hypothetical protein